MANGADELAIRLREGGPGIYAKGSFVVYLIVLVLCTLAVLYTIQRGFDHMVDQLRAVQLQIAREADNRATEHGVMTHGLDRTSCLLSLAPEDRVRFRREYVAGAFSRWCPWINADVLEHR